MYDQDCIIFTFLMPAQTQSTFPNHQTN